VVQTEITRIWKCTRRYKFW